MAKELLLQNTPKGIYCAAGDFYIDPWRPVERAVITHAHSDHARWGMKKYLAHKDSEPIMRLRLGEDIQLETMDYHIEKDINGVKVSFHPSGHIIGGAQVRVEHKGEVWVASGDYKVQNDNISPAFEPVKCHTFITESTFGLPIYQWKPQSDIFNAINNWWKGNIEKSWASVLCGYPLGKAQRLLQNVDRSLGPVFAHGTTHRVLKAYRNHGIKLPHVEYVDLSLPKGSFAGALILAPPGVITSSWIKRFEPYSSAVASGWMNLRGAKRRSAADVGFVLSDHADWEGLNAAIKATEAQRVFVTHGYTGTFAHWLREQGYNAEEWKTEFVGELEEEIDIKGEEEKE